MGVDDELGHVEIGVIATAGESEVGDSLLAFFNLIAAVMRSLALGNLKPLASSMPVSKSKFSSSLVSEETGALILWCPRPRSTLRSAAIMSDSDVYFPNEAPPPFDITPASADPPPPSCSGAASCLCVSLSGRKVASSGH